MVRGVPTDSLRILRESQMEDFVRRMRDWRSVHRCLTRIDADVTAITEGVMKELVAHAAIVNVQRLSVVQLSRNLAGQGGKLAARSLNLNLIYSVSVRV